MKEIIILFIKSLGIFVFIMQLVLFFVMFFIFSPKITATSKFNYSPLNTVIESPQKKYKVVITESCCKSGLFGSGIFSVVYLIMPIQEIFNEVYHIFPLAYGDNSAFVFLETRNFLEPIEKSVIWIDENHLDVKLSSGGTIFFKQNSKNGIQINYHD